MMQGIQTEEVLRLTVGSPSPKPTWTWRWHSKAWPPTARQRKLTMATFDLKLQSKTTIGRNQEHLKLGVTDEAGNSRTVLWWNGAGKKIRCRKSLDLAYSLRASDWRGTPQVQMEFVDFRRLAGSKSKSTGANPKSLIIGTLGAFSNSIHLRKDHQF